MNRIFALISIGLIALTGCDSVYPPTPRPDYTIHVVKTPQGSVAVPPTCPDYASATMNPYDNAPMPQFGCANARNLALMIDQPEDLVHGRDIGDSSGVVAVGAMRRYNNNQTRGLLDLDTSPDMAAAITTAPSASSSMTGDATGGGSSSSSAPAAAAALP